LLSHVRLLHGNLVPYVNYSNSYLPEGYLPTP
jgi:hypothetical protein